MRNDQKTKRKMSKYGSLPKQDFVANKPNGLWRTFANSITHIFPRLD